MFDDMVKKRDRDRSGGGLARACCCPIGSIAVVCIFHVVVKAQAVLSGLVGVAVAMVYQVGLIRYRSDRIAVAMRESARA